MNDFSADEPEDQEYYCMANHSCFDCDCRNCGEAIPKSKEGEQ